MKGLLIKGWSFTTDVCQECPCFTNFLYGYEDHSLVQLCKVNGHKIIRGPVPLDDVPDDWNKTERPEWCPVEVVDV